jgi:hypothetical protein
MVPILPPGTLVFAWRWYFKLRPGDVVIFDHDGKEKIKRIEKIEDGKFFLLGDLPDESTDSRQLGWFDQAAIVAKVLSPDTIVTQRD